MSEDCKEHTVVVRNKMGIHARPATQLVRLARSFDAEITLIKGDKSASASSVLGIMMLGSHCGEPVTIRTSGNDAEASLAAVVELLSQNFDPES